MSETYFVHPQGICESRQVGQGSRIWAFSHILPGAVIGQDCNICDHVFVENQVVLGDRVTVKCGVQLWDGLVVEDDVFIGPNATFTNDLFPRSKAHRAEYLPTRICSGASIGANATVMPGLTIGPGAMVGAGAVVTRSVPANAIVIGNPARIAGYAGSAQRIEAASFLDLKEDEKFAVRETGVKGVRLYHLPLVNDLRGSLSAAEVGPHVPFDVKRYFLVFDVPSVETRGEHAHRQCHQFLVCVSGQVSVVADDGSNREEFLLARKHHAIHLPPMTWGTQYKYSKDAVLLVLASHPYDQNDYIRNYEEFLQCVGNK
jgi:acetyltransferase-like isoleucine patch superfamily enzyme/dTDP-4-dehydrorhamnose 3,5-epimerase-like enzyme